MTTVLVPGSPGYESARRPAMARFHDSRPQAVALCESPADVAEALAVGPMRSVSVSDDLVTVGAGTRLGDLYDALDGHGVTIPAGCGPTVGIAGLTLGGGLGILGRKHGLTCDRLVAAEVVLADGRVVECDEDREPDLFWAQRGAGGGQFGVVTSLVFATVRAPPATTFHLVWPHTDATAVVAAWQDWAPFAPDELDASLRLVAAGDLNRPPVVNLLGTDATAFVHRDERFLVEHVVDVDPHAPAAERDAARSWVTRSWETVHPWGSGRVYPNFPDPALEDWAEAYHGSNYERLRHVKADLRSRADLPVPAVALSRR